jgi:hypothetical protein
MISQSVNPIISYIYIMLAIGSVKSLIDSIHLTLSSPHFLSEVFFYDVAMGFHRTCSPSLLNF